MAFPQSATWGHHTAEEIAGKDGLAVVHDNAANVVAAIGILEEWHGIEVWEVQVRPQAALASQHLKYQ